MSRPLRIAKRVVITIVLIGVTSCAIQYYRAGYLSLPDVPDQTVVFNFQDIMRGYVPGPGTSERDMKGQPGLLAAPDPNRIYLPLAFEVPEAVRLSWSECVTPPEEEERALLAALPAETLEPFQNTRLDYVCRVESEGQSIYRGMIFSFPRDE